ncbi:MAG: hypothetical protein A3J62_03500 [Candidatus Buchananbacteria bacterium RIFCSPHIGHO2_02_FULL_38_8]|uniref:SHS2 domain-containing protein n=2 Tax=Candidatus Buchananiibacteriota TaxID=1817903 RepID=A0A1G1XSY1_9BACT|nr:MAG: hypothetical protein A2731_03590 [Candidatus Buchananbacteria bacterium RIFCSPHIGHO2_01_FULL_39_8]OGY47229.1 MAG: hypothetical protein A3J62_03500 [Candidatus Buchananbacteria bacterium RIFCSPHIGHO2_02_FULL_38_8]
MNFSFDKKIFGLDISDRALRLIQLQKKGRKFFLNSYNEVVIPPEIIIGGEIKNEEKFIQLINQLIKSVEGKRVTTKNVISVLPEPKTFIKVINIKSSLKDGGISELIQEEIENHIPFSLEEIYLDWQILKRTNGNLTILVGAAPKNIVDSYTTALEKSGLTPLVLEIEGAAIIRTLLFEKDQGAKIIIDFGAVRTGLILYDKGTIQFTVSLPISGIKITEAIQETLNLDWQKAEKAKIICGLDPTKCEGALLKILMNTIDRLVIQIKKAITFYQTNFSNKAPISEIIICGGGANFSNINEVLSSKLGLPVKIANPLINVSQTKKINIPSAKALSYTTAIGLALKVFQKDKK